MIELIKLKNSFWIIRAKHWARRFRNRELKKSDKEKKLSKMIKN